MSTENIDSWKLLGHWFADLFWSIEMCLWCLTCMTHDRIIYNIWNITRNINFTFIFYVLFCNILSLRAFFQYSRQKNLLILCRVFRIYNFNELYVLDFNFPCTFGTFLIMGRVISLAIKLHFRWLKMGRFENLQLVGENWPNLPNKCITIYIGMTCRYSELSGYDMESPILPVDVTPANVFGMFLYRC